MATLLTNLEHLKTANQLKEVIESNKNVMVCCGRMGRMCIPVYSAMEILRSDYQDVKFFDMPFDSPEAHIIRNLPECANFMGLPFTVYYKDGKVVKATTSIQSKEQIKEIIEQNFVSKSEDTE